MQKEAHKLGSMGSTLFLERLLRGLRLLRRLKVMGLIRGSQRKKSRLPTLVPSNKRMAWITVHSIAFDSVS